MTPTGMFSSEICFRWCNFCILAKTTVFDRFGGALAKTESSSLTVKKQLELISVSGLDGDYANKGVTFYTLCTNKIKRPSISLEEKCNIQQHFEVHNGSLSTLL